MPEKIVVFTEKLEKVLSRRWHFKPKCYLCDQAVEPGQKVVLRKNAKPAHKIAHESCWEGTYIA